MQRVTVVGSGSKLLSEGDVVERAVLEDHEGIGVSREGEGLAGQGEAQVIEVAKRKRVGGVAGCRRCAVDGERSRSSDGRTGAGSQGEVIGQG